MSAPISCTPDFTLSGCLTIGCVFTSKPPSGDKFKFQNLFLFLAEALPEFLAVVSDKL